MHSPIYLNDATSGIFKELNLKFSKKVYICTPDAINENILSSIDFTDAFLIVDHSDDPIKESLFDSFHYPKLLINLDKLIIVSPTPNQLFYQEQGRLDIVKVNRKFQSSKKFKHIFCNGNWIKVKNLFNPRLLQDKRIEKYFLCLSREDKIHRRLLNYNLHKGDFFKKGIVSHQRAPSGIPIDIKSELNEFLTKNNFDPVLYKKYAFTKHFVDELTDESKDIGKAKTAYLFEYYANLNKRIIFDLVVESHFSDYLFVTEKLLKPIIFKTPFLVLGCPFTLRYLKSLGFKTFDSVFDESYDEELVLYDRVEKIMSNIDKACSLSLPESVKHFKITKEICEHNYNHFLNSNWDFNIQNKVEHLINV